MTHPVQNIIAKWPRRKDLLEDARPAKPDLDIVAVHRWYQRSSIPSEYWECILAGAARRGVGVKAADLVSAHSNSPSNPAPSSEGAAADGSCPLSKVKGADSSIQEVEA